MAHLKRRRIPLQRENCLKCRKGFLVGEVYQTSLLEEKGEWKREDYCLNCFNLSTTPPAEMTWKGKIRKEEEKGISLSFEKLLDELLETEEPLWGAFLGEVLLRRGVIKRRGQKLIEVIHTGEVVELERIAIPLHLLVTFQERLEQKTSH